MKKVVVLTSGGMDSTVLLYHHINAGDEVRAIAFNYGQRHLKELEFAEANAKTTGAPFQLVDVRGLASVLPGSSQTDEKVAVPLGHYSEESMKATVVPNRNMILLAIAIGHAIAHKMDFVSYAAHAGDHAIYPDCRPAFAKAMGAVATKCDWRKINLLRPFIEKTKSVILQRGKALGVDFLKTYSCYKGQDLHCGRCGTCVERREAFYLSGIPDPTTYDPSAPFVAEMVEKGWKA